MSLARPVKFRSFSRSTFRRQNAARALSARLGIVRERRNGHIKASALAAKPNSELDLGVVSNAYGAQRLILELGERANGSFDLTFVFPVRPQ